MTFDERRLREKLEELRAEHRDLDTAINGLMSVVPCDQLALQRLKKRKLSLKDTIIRVESMLIEDIIA